MKFKNLSRVERNMLTGLFCQFVTILLGFLMPRLYLTYYGSGVNGELNTIKQLFAYLYLLEAGVGLATTQALYRPVAMEEHQTVSEILAATDHYYRRTGTLYAFIVVAIGIVYGDIGTSPLYVMKSILEGNGGITQINESFIVGALSLIIWTITLLTTIKYVLIAMKADNHGEGGIFSLYSLVRSCGKWLIVPAMLLAILGPLLGGALRLG